MGSTPIPADHHKPVLPSPALDEAGLYSQDWLSDSSGDIRRDMQTAEGEGKRLAIFWEQKDCVYCSPTHEINLRIPRIVEKVTQNFRVIRLDIWGGRNIIDADGSQLPEQEFARKNNIFLTPTVQFPEHNTVTVEKRGIIDNEAFRFEGYFKPFHYYFLFHYVVSKGYISEPSFQRWLGEIGKRLQEDNIKYDLWADALPPTLPDRF